MFDVSGTFLMLGIWDHNMGVTIVASAVGNATPSWPGPSSKAEAAASDVEDEILLRHGYVNSCSPIRPQRPHKHKDPIFWFSWPSVKLDSGYYVLYDPSVYEAFSTPEPES